jgi:dCTP deaminase
MVKNDKWILDNGSAIVSPFDREMVNPTSLDIRIGYKLLLMAITNRYRYKTLLKMITEREEEWIADDTLDNKVAMLNDLVEWQEIDLTKTSETAPFWLFPNSKILVESLETFNFPNDICGQFKLKSSRGREFYNHILAGWIDCGWSGSKLTMEIENRSKKILPIFKGQRMGQIIFFENETPNSSYKVTGRYNNDLTVQISKD